MKFLRYLFILISISIVNVNKNLQSININVDKTLGIVGIITSIGFTVGNLIDMKSKIYNFRNVEQARKGMFEGLNKNRKKNLYEVGSFLAPRSSNFDMFKEFVSFIPTTLLCLISYKLFKKA